VERPQEVIQVVERTAGGELQVENLGITVSRRRLVLNGLSATVFADLKTWHSDVAVGALNEFYYDDENGSANLVRWIDDTLNMPEYFGGKYSVEITLEIVT